METAEHKNHELMLKLDNVADSFDLLNFENFDELFPKVLNEMELIHKIKSALIATYGSENLLEFESEANFKVKIIEERF
ncbi:MAG: hypothetical protein Q8Q63_15340, partial [Phaeovulum sp.]|uniref:hypothetical protein n=1 Tax=Phaeovulum sp. TaxID=2934796 RepID=UPI0027323F35